MVALLLHLIQHRLELVSLWHDFWDNDIRIGLTPAIENHSPIIALKYSSERQLVPLEDELLSKNHAFRSVLEYVLFGLQILVFQFSFRNLTPTIVHIIFYFESLNEWYHGELFFHEFLILYTPHKSAKTRYFFQSRCTLRWSTYITKLPGQDKD